MLSGETGCLGCMEPGGLDIKSGAVTLWAGHIWSLNGLLKTKVPHFLKNSAHLDSANPLVDLAWFRHGF